MQFYRMMTRIILQNARKLFYFHFTFVSALHKIRYFPFWVTWQYTKNQWDQLIPFRDISDQIILQSDWLEDFPSITPALSCATSHEPLNHAKYQEKTNVSFESERYRVGYQSNQKLLHHYRHAKNQHNSKIHS